ncbi:hypothetical protein BOTCAL_0179g00230 [Botryotinia calthae]|uniref:Uncharacterized protein n=1 Tax=Botryotinia calthae TaxID=38488 RepID=A0A4Y8D0L5_9HELO|nr:hypothetical protein BOTCAL_0179g00230 [Botryotinia calthae]
MVFVPPPLITHDRDFRATKDSINDLRDRVGHPTSCGQQTRSLKFFAANQPPKVESQQKRLKVKAEYSSDLSPLTIKLVKSVYLLQRAIEPRQFSRVQPSYLTRYSGTSHDRTFYHRAVKTYVSNLERDILERMRNVASSMIAETISTDRFKEICRSDNSRQDIELFFAQSATNDQLHYVYSKLWTAVDFGFVKNNNLRLNALEEQVRKGVRQMIKWDFGFAAADYFNLCIQRIGIPVYFSDDEDSNDETLDSHTWVAEENDRSGYNDAAQHDDDQARLDFRYGWKQLTNNWNMATYSHSQLARVSKDAVRLPLTEIFDAGRVRELGEERALFSKRQNHSGYSEIIQFVDCCTFK